MMEERKKLEQIIITAAQMREIEEKVFANGMPQAALMEKAANLCAERIQQMYPISQASRVGILVGPGHNGADALVIARELYLKGYQILIYRPLSKLKDLTAQHAKYAHSLGIPCYEDIQPLQMCDLIVDGLFGFGLTRSLTGKIAEAVELLNTWSKTVVSIDIPSGIHTDTGEVLGTALRAKRTFCLGLWKQAFFQDLALEYIGEAQLIDIGIPPIVVWSVLPQPAPTQQMTKAVVKSYLPLPRPFVTHKYQQGHLLIICGSRRYSGGALLTGLGARASGVGMLSIAVPESLKPILTNNLPEALIVGSPETEAGAIASIPLSSEDLTKFDIIACGPGLTVDAQSIVQKVLQAKCPIVLDADALNILAQLGTISALSSRQYPTILTPHLGEFKRLFPSLLEHKQDRIKAVREASQQSGAIILFKGSRSAIAHPNGSVWVVSQSTPALARGGTGDVLTGLIAGLIAQTIKLEIPLEATVASAAWWHAHAGIIAVQERTELGVDAYTLSQYLIPALRII
jgi:ADP-dependent NAD(P)H-hydrate dehydratase / NAD(P)H-hydrate epimerase